MKKLIGRVRGKWTGFRCRARSDVQIEIGIPGIGLEGVKCGYSHSNTGIIPAGGITTSNPTLGATENRHTIRITGIECIPITTVIISHKASVGPISN